MVVVASAAGAAASASPPITSSAAADDPAAAPAAAAPDAAAPLHGDHPPYRDMILAAIEALKEREGSSKRAISKFIGQTYGELSPQHDVLLAQNLRQMTGERVLRLVKRSYKIGNPSSPQQPAPSPRPRGRPRKNFVPLFVPTGTTVKLKGDPNAGNPPAAPRRRGRPPKAVRTVGTVVRRKPGRPRKVPASQAAEAGVPPAAAAGRALIPLPAAAAAAAARKRGRPPKVAAAGAGEKRRPGRPRKLPGAITVAVLSKPRRGPGRPPKAAASAEGKRRPGRPRKVPAAAAAAAAGAGAAPAVEKSKPGWELGRAPYLTAAGTIRKRRPPRKVPRTVATATIEASTPGQKPGSPPKVPAAAPALDGKRKRGRPPKAKPAVAGGGDATNPTAVKRRGRPPKKVELVQSSTPAEQEKTDEAEKQVEAEKAEAAGPSAPPEV